MLLLATTACSDDGGADAARATVPQHPTAVLQLVDYALNPSNTVLPAGEQATISVRNAGAVVHNLSIPSITADLDLQPGETRTVIFVAPESGQVEVFCKLHRDRGMTGTFEAG